LFQADRSIVERHESRKIIGRGQPHGTGQAFVGMGAISQYD
jgi:hypothetical protein